MPLRRCTLTPLHSIPAYVVDKIPPGAGWIWDDRKFQIANSRPSCLKKSKAPQAYKDEYTKQVVGRLDKRLCSEYLFPVGVGLMIYLPCSIPTAGLSHASHMLS